MSLKSFDIIFSSLVLIYTVILTLNTFNIVLLHKTRNKSMVNMFYTFLYFVFFPLLIVYCVKYTSILNDNIVFNFELLYKTIIISIFVLFLVFILVVDYLRNYLNMHLSENAIKEGLDYLDGGLCYFKKDGRILLKNI